MRTALWCLLLAVPYRVGCDCGGIAAPRADASEPDSGSGGGSSGGGPIDSGVDAGVDAGLDAGPPPDGGCVDTFALSTLPLFTLSSRYVLTADFNSDGRPDVATLGGTGGHVLLGRGDGTIAADFAFDAGVTTLEAVAGDFDRDGKLDLACVTQNVGLVQLFPGNGDGTLRRPIVFDGGRNLSSLAAGDFDRDGTLDLVTGDYGSGSVNLVFGHGDGGFAEPVSYSVLGNPLNVTASDVNGDGLLDVSANATAAFFDAVQMFYGEPDGGLRSVVGYSSVTRFGGIRTADFNRDGLADFAVVTMSGVAVFLFDGGRVGDPVIYPAGGRLSVVLPGDYDGDGLLDLAAALDGPPLLGILKGNGDGTFQTATSFGVGPRPWGLSRLDFNGDGRDDLVFANGGVLLGHGDGTFTGGRHYAVGGMPTGLGLCDYDGDGLLDVAVADDESFGPWWVRVLLGAGDGGLRAPLMVSAQAPSRTMACGDLDGDGRAELVLATNAMPRVSVLHSLGDGGFLPGVVFAASSIASAALVVDVDGDGHADVALSHNTGPTVGVLRGAGDGGLLPAVSYPVSAGPLGLVAADFDNDGRLDLACAGTALSVVLGQGDGGFAAARVFDAGYFNGLAAADFDRDGRLDVALVDTFYGRVSVARGGGDGTFSRAGSWPTPRSPINVAAADLTGDGVADLAVTTNDQRVVVVLIGVGDGTFRPYQAYGAGLRASAIGVGDLDRNGIADVVVGNNGDGTIDVLTNHQCRP